MAFYLSFDKTVLYRTTIVIHTKAPFQNQNDEEAEKEMVYEAMFLYIALESTSYHLNNTS